MFYRYTKKKDEKERELDLVTAEFVPLEPTRLSFWQKFAELQYKMLIADNVRKNMPYDATGPPALKLFKTTTAN